MRTSERTYYNLKRLHLWMAVSSLLLLAVTVWTLIADHNRQWKQYQRTFQDRIQPRMTAARIRQEQSRESPDQEELGRLRRMLREQRPSLGKRLLRLPLIDALGRPLAIEQIWLPELTIDYNFRQVARFDRCMTCHQGIDQTLPGDPSQPAFPRSLPHPYRSHPRLDLFVGSPSPHPMTEFGCTICHDGQGSATELKWASHTPNDAAQRDRWREDYGWFRNPHWDLPMLPKRFAQSRCLKCHHEVTDLESSRRWPDPPAQKLLAGYNLVRLSGCFGCHEIKGIDESGRSIGPDMRLEPNRAQAAGGPTPPGTLRKVGPSLREVAGRLEAVFLDNWIRNPAVFRPDTRMPRFYGLHAYLEGPSLADAKRFEAVELRAITDYLLAASRPVEPLAAPAEVTEPPSAERGRRLFEIHGCLACHRHDDFPEGQSIQGADLSRLGSKYTNEIGKAWLVSWIRDPVRHSPRTRMPNSLLEPVPLEVKGGDAGAAPPRMSDPAADIAAYLLDSDQGKPKEPAPLDEADLDELAKSYPGKADRDPVGLLGQMTVEEKLLEVGRRTIARRGCYGCHDIAGFENAQPIGPALTDWGRKQESLLAFEQIHEFIRAAVPAAAKQPKPAGVKRSDAARLAAAGTAATNTDPDRAFFIEALLAHRREGFIWQKLRGPRSFDFRMAEAKGYNEWLTMGRFQLSDQQREAIITFVLGLVAEPPAEKYVYHPDARRKAIAQGRKVLDKYACAECHTLEMERWTFEFDPDEFADPPTLPDYDFLRPKISPEEIAASQEIDLRGRGHAEVTGMPRVDAAGELLEDEDDEGNPLYFFTLFEPAAINGKVWTVGGAELTVSGPQLLARRAPLGGALARLLHPRVLAQARQPGSRATELEARGWVPPPLVAEGEKVRPAWLHDFLLEPTPIRPAAVLRMPRYNMSAEEAGKLVDYFAAVSGVDFPYSSHPRSRAAYLEGMERRQPGRLERAMQILVDGRTYCAKCHLIGDSGPGGEIRTTLAPNLDRVGRRIRPEYLRRWLANPKSVLPYTAMPVNFPPSGQPLDPTRFPGNSLEQLDAVMDLLVNYDWYVKRRAPIRRLLEPAAEMESDPAGRKR